MFLYFRRSALPNALTRLPRSVAW